MTWLSVRPTRNSTIPPLIRVSLPTKIPPNRFCGRHLTKRKLNWGRLQVRACLISAAVWALCVRSRVNTASLRARVERERWENMVNPTHFYYFTRKSLEAALRRAGFSDVRELQISIRYPEHRIVRRIVHHALVSCRLEGQLVFLARQRMLE